MLNCRHAYSKGHKKVLKGVRLRFLVIFVFTRFCRSTQSYVDSIVLFFISEVMVRCWWLGGAKWGGMGGGGWLAEGRTGRGIDGGRWGAGGDGQMGDGERTGQTTVNSSEISF